jgi:hypothetical protein
MPESVAPFAAIHVRMAVSVAKNAIRIASTPRAYPYHDRSVNSSRFNL